MDSNQPPKKTYGVTKELQTALERLENYIQAKAQEEETRETHPLRRIAGLARCFITALVSDEVRDRGHLGGKETSSSVLDAIEVVQRNYLVLEQLRRGTPAQTQLAEGALEIIQRFNQVVQQEQAAPSLERRFTRFLQGKQRKADEESVVINVPLPAFWRDRSDQKQRSLSSHRLSIHEGTNKVASLAQSCRSGITEEQSPTQREVDAFRMKAVTMVRSLSYPSPSMSETLYAVRQCPLNISNATSSKGETPLDANIVTFSQTLEAFPGELLTLEGSFLRHKDKHGQSTPLPDSFQLSTKSLQSGFPFPEQHNGWALSEKLIPCISDDLTHRPVLEQLAKQRRLLANQLLPGGTKRERAIRCIRLKKLAAQRSKDEWLHLHYRLVLALQQGGGLSSHSNNPTKSFFSWLRIQENPWGPLCQTYRLVAEWFIHRPNDHLHELWIVPKHAAHMARLSPDERFQHACQIWHTQVQSSLESMPDYLPQHVPQLPLEKTASFLREVGLSVTDGALTMILQFMAGKLSTTPPLLGSFASRLQYAVYHQLLQFLWELEQLLPEEDEEAIQWMQQYLLQSVEKDIEIFENPEALHIETGLERIAKELSVPSQVQLGSH